MKKLFPIFLLFSFRLYAHTETLTGNRSCFTENKGQIIDASGQTRPDILFVSDQPGLKIFFRKTGISYVLVKNDVLEKSATDFIHANSAPEGNLFFHRIDMDFVNSSNNIQVIPQREGTGTSSYYYPHCSQGITNVKSFEKIIYKDVFPKIDFVFYSPKDQGLKYDIIVRPGGNPSDINLKYSGQDKLEIKNAELIIKNSLEEVIENLPKVYQKINGEIKDIECKYKLRDNQTISFKLGTLNPKLETIIDPWCTYFGGSYLDGAGDITTDKNGEVIFTGQTTSIDFPVSPGAYQTTLSSAFTDAHIAKFNSSGQRVWTTYYGGTLQEIPTSIVADSRDFIFISGFTQSNNLPIQASLGAPTHQPVKNALYDIFIAKFTPSGFLDWSTFYGGSASDFSYDMNVDNNDDVAFVGYTLSDATSLPVSTGAYQNNNNGNGDVIIAKFSNAGAFIWSTYFGGAEFDKAQGIDMDNNNDIVFTGNTRSADFPVLGTTIFQSVKPSPTTRYSAFVSKLNGITGTPQWSTYIGGPGQEYLDVKVVTDRNNNIYATSSAESGFPVTAGCFQSVFGGGRTDTWLAKFNTSGNLLWATYLGGSLHEESYGITIDDNDEVYISGDTYSDDFPSTSCAYATHPGICTSSTCEYAYLAKFDAQGNRLCSGYWSWDAHNEVFTIAEYKGLVYLLGNTPSATAPTTPGAFQPVYNNNNDVILTQLCGFTCGLHTMASDFLANKTDLCVGETTNFTPTYTSCDTTHTSWLWNFQGAVNSTSTQKNPSGISYSSPGIYKVTLIVTTPCDTDTVIKTGYINVHSSPVASIVTTGEVCNGQSTNLTASITGGLAAYTYNWNTGSSATSLTITPTTSSIYQLTVTDARGCSTITQTSVTVFPIPIVSFNRQIFETCDTICIRYINTSQQCISFHCQFDNGDVDTTRNVYRCYSQNTAYTVTLTIVSKNHCVGSRTFSDSVTFHPKPIADFTMDPITATTTNPLINFTDRSTNVNTRLWNFGDGATEVQTNPNHAYTEEGAYCITLLVANEFGCTDTAVKCIDVEPNFSFYYPNTFTPNGDGINDCFLPKGVGINNNAHMWIYDRWGNLIYETTNLAKGWDGKASAVGGGGEKIVQQDVYVWKIRFDDLLSQQHNYVGHVTLIK